MPGLFLIPSNLPKKPYPLVRCPLGCKEKILINIHRKDLNISQVKRPQATMIIMIVVGLNTAFALGGKIGVCQPGSREVAKLFKNTNETKPYKMKIAMTPDMN